MKFTNCEEHCLLLITYCLHFIWSLSWERRAIYIIYSPWKTPACESHTFATRSLVVWRLHCGSLASSYSFFCMRFWVCAATSHCQRERWELRHRSLVRSIPYLVSTITLQRCYSYYLWCHLVYDLSYTVSFVSRYVHFQRSVWHSTTKARD